MRTTSTKRVHEMIEHIKEDDKHRPEGERFSIELIQIDESLGALSTLFTDAFVRGKALPSEAAIVLRQFADRARTLSAMIKKMQMDSDAD